MRDGESHMQWLKQWMPRRPWKRWMLFVFCTLLILLAADMLLVQHWRTIHPGPQTTGVSQFVPGTRMPDYAAALNTQYGAGVTPQNNVAGPLLSIVGTADVPEAWRKATLPALGLPDREIAPGFTGFPEWAVAYDAVNPATDRSWEDNAAMERSPWKSSDHHEWAQWLGEQEPALAKARAALQRDRFFVPLRSTPSGVISVEDFQAFSALYHGTSELANALDASALRAAGAGDTASFTRDSLAALKLSHLFGQGPLLSDTAIAWGIHSRASEAIRGAVVSGHALTDAQARQLIATIDSMGPIPTADAAFDRAERWQLLSMLCEGAQSGPDQMIARMAAEQDFRVPEKSPSLGLRLKALITPMHFDAALEECNQLTDRIVVALHRPTHQDRLEALAAIERDIRPYRGAGIGGFMFRPAEALAAGILDAQSFSPGTLAGMYERCQVELDLTRVSLALAAYRDIHKEYPDRLDALQEILGLVPMDGFSGEPLAYMREGEGYLLYSVGPDHRHNLDISNNQWWRVVRADA